MNLQRLINAFKNQYLCNFLSKFLFVPNMFSIFICRPKLTWYILLLLIYNINFSVLNFITYFSTKCLNLSHGRTPNANYLATKCSFY